MTYSIVIRVPWKRQNEEIIWDENKDNMLWKFISLHSQPNEIDWNSISSRLNINENECKQRASHLYKQQFIKLQSETLLNISASNNNGNNNNTTSTTTTSSDNNTFSQQINRQQQQQQQQQQQKSPIPPPSRSNVEDIQRLVISVQRNSYDWIKVSKEVGLPPLECRNLFLSYQQQQKSPVNNNYNTISNSSAFLNNNNNNNNIQRVQQNFLRRSSNDNPILASTIEGSITQSELIDALIDEEDRQKLQQRR